jgi:hypothetical protein
VRKCSSSIRWQKPLRPAGTRAIWCLRLGFSAYSVGDLPLFQLRSSLIRISMGRTSILAEPKIRSCQKSERLQKRWLNQRSAQRRHAISRHFAFFAVKLRQQCYKASGTCKLKRRLTLRPLGGLGSCWNGKFAWKTPEPAAWPRRLREARQIKQRTILEGSEVRYLRSKCASELPHRDLSSSEPDARPKLESQSGARPSDALRRWVRHFACAGLW